MTLCPLPRDTRRDLTFRFNRHHGRHGWLRLTPAYSVRAVEEILSASDVGAVLDPFSGTATTPLTAAYFGIPAAGVELNPFLHWLGNLKLGRFSDSMLVAAKRSAELAVSACRRGDVSPAEPPPIHNIERWWSSATLAELCALKGALSRATVQERASEKVSSLLSVAFCRTIIAESNAAFNHQSMSFKQPSAQLELAPISGLVAERYLRELATVLASASDNPGSDAVVTLGDSREIDTVIPRSYYDTVITSPPYPNRISYIRELRPYMYWLGYLQESRDAGELDWSAIGGTWGIATSRLMTWQATDSTHLVEPVRKAAGEIENCGEKNGPLLARYVLKYFADIWQHLQSLTPVLARPARVHYIVGNSQFFGRLIATELAYAHMLQCLGFEDVSVTALRKRNSNKALFEYCVSGRLRGAV